MITGKVIRILDEYSLIINVGAKHGVKKGMKFIVYEEGDEIIDPETNKSLGKLEFVKGTIEVVNVQENFSLAMSAEFYPETTIKELTFALTRFGGRRKRLPVDENVIEPLQTPVSNKIKVGDKVKSIS